MHVMSEGSKTLPKPMGQEPIGGKPAMGHPVPAAISRPKLGTARMFDNMQIPLADPLICQNRVIHI